MGNSWRFPIKSVPNNECVSVTSAHGMNLVKTAVVPADGGTLSVDCQVNIYDSRGFVFSKTFDTTCPNITYICQANECPPGTCEVDCGDHICCYDNRGIAIQTIAK